MKSDRGSIRRQTRIARCPGDVWELVGSPGRIAEWFPGITSCTVEGNERVVTTGSGLSVAERLVTIDPLQRRFQYRITSPLVRDHLGTIDVLDLGAGTSLVVYSTDAEPASMALIIGGAAGSALEHLRALMET